MAAFNPYLETDLRDVKAQGASVGDSRSHNGQDFSWNGVTWNPAGGQPNATGAQGNQQSYIQSAIDQMKKVNEPIVKSYEESIPETQKKFSAQSDSIKSRYDNLIASIKGNQGVAETRQTTTTNNELGRRGITGSSGVAQQEMTNALNPITQQYTGFLKEANTAQGEETAANVAGETDALRAIKNAIAQLQSGANSQGVSLGTDMFTSDRNFGESQRVSQLQSELQKEQMRMQQEQAQKDEAFRQQQLAESTRQFNTQEGRLGASSNTGDLSSLFNVLGISTQNNQQGNYIPSIGKSVVGYLADGRALYSDGSAGWSNAKK